MEKTDQYPREYATIRCHEGGYGGRGALYSYPQCVGILPRTEQGEGGLSGISTSVGESAGWTRGNIQLGKKWRKRRRNRREARELRADARARSRAEKLIVGKFNVCTLAFDGKTSQATTVTSVPGVSCDVRSPRDWTRRAEYLYGHGIYRF